VFVVKDHGQANSIKIPESVLLAGKGSLIVNASNCDIEIESQVQLRNLALTINGDGTVLRFGKDCVLSGAVIVKSPDSCLKIGRKTTWMNVFISFHERGSIVMGEDCMLSGDIRMDVSDMHSIIDVQTGMRINPAADIMLGDHVWVGQGVFITKGCVVGSNVIIGAKALVTKDMPDNVLVAGVPARVIREGVTWDRRRL